MNEILKAVLSLSLSGSLLILLLFLLRPLFKERLSKRWQYYIWLVVVARLILPFAPETNLMATLFQGIDRAIEQTEIVSPYTQQGGIADIPQTDEEAEEQKNLHSGQTEPAKLVNNPVRNIVTAVWKNLWLGWLVVALILYIRKITVYQDFVKYIRAGCVEVAEIDLLERFGKLIECNKVKTTVELYTNNLISSPLLIGFFRPSIILPNADLPPVDFEYTILHELTHYKRRDMFYKWLVQFSVCVHWFNPLVYMMGREVGRACELSCDETVIRELDLQERRAYGDTLFNAMGAGGNYKDSLASITLNESKELLKERLDAIMSFKKKSKLCFVITAVLTISLCFGATVSGAALSSSMQTNVNSNRSSTSGVDTKSNPINSQSYQAGNIISFGKFNNQSLKWKVLEINDENKALLFATDVLPNTWLPFDKTSNVWETSSIRSWLNGTQKGEFLAENNFTQEERRAIIQTQISTGILGNATNDYVFLISKDEYYKYDIGNVSYDIDSFWSRTGEPDSGIDNSDIDELKKNFPNVALENYPGSVALFASYHQASGSFNASEKGGIRPMLWIDLGALSSDGNSSIENQVNQQNDTIKTNANDELLSIAIQNTNNLISSTSGRKYMVYGPFDGTSIESVTCKLNNDVEARLEMVLSGQDKTIEGVERTNCIGFGKEYTNTLYVSNDLLNANQQFYVFIGSDNIKNLTGTVSFSSGQN